MSDWLQETSICTKRTSKTVQHQNSDVQHL